MVHISHLTRGDEYNNNMEGLAIQCVFAISFCLRKVIIRLKWIKKKFFLLLFNIHSDRYVDSLESCKTCSYNVLKLLFSLASQLPLLPPPLFLGICPRGINKNPIPRRSELLSTQLQSIIQYVLWFQWNGYCKSTYNTSQVFSLSSP